MLCIANTRRNVLQSRSFVHNTMSSGHFGRAIRKPFLRAKSHNFQFFQTRFKFQTSFFKMLNFQTIEKLISLHMHFNSVYYTCFVDLDPADSALKPIFENARNLSFMSLLDELISKRCFKFRSPHIPSSAFECSRLNGLSKQPLVSLASRSFAGSG